jgi:hypothetical protein
MIKSLDAVYRECIVEGIIQYSKEAGFGKAKTLLEIAEKDIETLRSIEPIFEEKQNFSLAWSSRYEVIRQLVDAILLLEKVKSENHQCLFAHACMKHRDWGIEWDSIETMRLLRNKVHYEGKPVPNALWQSYKEKFNIYTEALIKILKEKLRKG